MGWGPETEPWAQTNNLFIYSPKSRPCSQGKLVLRLSLAKGEDFFGIYSIASVYAFSNNPVLKLKSRCVNSERGFSEIYFFDWAYVFPAE